MASVSLTRVIEKMKLENMNMFKHYNYIKINRVID